MTQADKIYVNLLAQVLTEGDKVVTRNSITTSHFNLPNVTFTEFPLVTLKRTAAKKAISEMEWFMSGNSRCPENLLDWWEGQLNEDNRLISGYASQFRQFSTDCYGYLETFDQIKFILEGLKTSPNSRRLIMTVWNPGEMANIPNANSNPNTPTCCHSIVVQFFVRQGKLHMKTYQRSADMLLGVPHNWTQSWTMLLYFAYHSSLQVGSMTWMWGDAHIYEEESHLQAVDTMLSDDVTDFGLGSDITLTYQPEQVEYDSNGVPVFKASDFIISGEIPVPIVTNKIKML
jgi:thymidylate synthase